ncbi:fructose-specific PTS transporter subunit EIIC [Culicoidibacter larvae]|uniref:PTS fructose transporter subunit IIABC n=1 Tax=Culicoidibacter larvae TaxID=2579976 RepID=A0A5R8QF99_9FIRM|nr:fructose-specific PTS transporter subunit EIIC [Culicoidibacter larvae]TLG76685.1 PTS fructose transporter subunit IIABC [Culicoidibacter larvae]
MNVQSILKKELIILDADYATKAEVIDALLDKMSDLGVFSDKAAVKAAVYEREAVSPTGLENGLAIPHGKSAAIKEAAVGVARLKRPIADWESIDKNNQVDLVFLLAIPDQEAGSTHLQLLADLSTRLADKSAADQLKAAKTKEEFIAFFGQDVKKATVSSGSDKFILGVTACSTGIAHTYMAASSLEAAAAELGYAIKVEKQGANGLEDKITAEDVKRAEAVIFAVDVAVKEKARFAGLPYVETRVAEPLHDAKAIVERVLNNPDGVVEGDTLAGDIEADMQKRGKFFGRAYQGILTGISYMIPVLVGAGLMTGIAKLLAMAFGVTDIITTGAIWNEPNQLIICLFYLDKFGSLLLGFIYPIFAMFAAYSIADRPGLIPGFAGGVLAAGINYTIWGIGGHVPSGFIGALILGLAAGFIADFFNRKIKVSKNLNAIKPMLIIPGLTLLLVFLLNYTVVEPVFGFVNQWLQDAIRSASDLGQYTMSAIIAGLTAFDLGGPVNKAAGAVAIPLATEGVFPLTARVLSIVIPPIGLGLATVLDRFVVGRRVFEDDLRITGNTSLLLGFIAVSEGAIPFMLKNPLITIPINIIGAILGSWVAIFFGAEQWLPLPAIWGWPLVTNLPAYLLGLAVGVLFIAFANIFVRFYIIKRHERKQQA